MCLTSLLIKTLQLAPPDQRDRGGSSGTITKPSRAMSRCSSAKVLGGSGMPSGVCTVARYKSYLKRAPRRYIGTSSPGRRCGRMPAITHH